ncbi:MAG: hypothetical protein WC835_00555 [Candidatus Paceibacterota bacterium]|jgi:hypothetical protein
MTEQKIQIAEDAFIIAMSVIVSVIAAKSGLAHFVVSSLDGLRYFGVFVTGMFFTFVFTTAPAIVVLGEFAQNNYLPTVALIGGLGAVIGDYIIFLFVRDRVSQDLRYLLSFSGAERFTVIFKTKLFYWLVPFLGAVIIASPFPDEIGVSMLGLSKIGSRYFLFISFVFNSLGVFIVGRLAQLAL